MTKGSACSFAQRWPELTSCAALLCAVCKHQVRDDLPDLCDERRHPRHRSGHDHLRDPARPQRRGSRTRRRAGRNNYGSRLAPHSPGLPRACTQSHACGLAWVAARRWLAGRPGWSGHTHITTCLFLGEVGWEGGGGGGQAGSLPRTASPVSSRHPAHLQPARPRVRHPLGIPHTANASHQPALPRSATPPLGGEGSGRTTQHAGQRVFWPAARRLVSAQTTVPSAHGHSRGGFGALGVASHGCGGQAIWSGGHGTGAHGPIRRPDGRRGP